MRSPNNYMRLAPGAAGRLLPAWWRLALHTVRERALWTALGLGLLALLLAYQSPRPLLVDIGGNLDGPHTVGFHEPESVSGGTANYRWSASHSALIFQGIGKPLAPLLVQLQLSGGHKPQGDEVGVTVTANGHSVPPLKLNPASALYTVRVDPSWIDASGDLRLDFSSPTFRAGNDKRDLGFQADFARVEFSSGPVIPPPGQLLGLLLCAYLLYLMLRGVWLAPRAAGLLASLFLLAAAGTLAVQRLLLTIFTERLLITLAIAMLVTIAAELAVRRLTGAAGRRGAEGLPGWSWAALRGLLLFSAAVKVGGLLYPYSFIVDAPFHLKYITLMNEVLFSGRSFNQYFGESLAFAVMPREEWGSARAFIPYSPFFYVAAAPLAWLPLPLAITVPVFSGIFEAFKTALVFMVGVALGRTQGGARAGKFGVAAAGVYSIIPATFLLQQWGNWPTQTSLWLLTAWAAVTTLFWRRITRPVVWLGTTLLLSLAMLAYTVTAAYTGLFVLMLVAGGLLFAGHERKRWGALFLSLVGATGVSLAVYYGQYVGRILGDTLPTFGKAAQSQGSLTTLRPTLGEFLTDHLGRAFYSYNLGLIYLLGFAGAVYLFWGQRQARVRQRAAKPRSAYAFIHRQPHAGATAQPWQRVWIGAWLLTFPLFTLGDFYVDQAFKQFWYALPALSLVAGMWLLTLLGKRHVSRLYPLLAWLLVAVLAWQSVSLWVFRLLFHNR